MVIGPDGGNLGKMSSRAANELAIKYGLDLYCVAPDATPPVCKILNYGQYLYNRQKSERAARKNSKAAQLKEIQLHVSIGAHDRAVKAKRAVEFLQGGDKVNIRVVLKGREMDHQEIAEDLMKIFLDDITAGFPTVSIEKQPFWEGKCYSAIVASKSRKQ